MAADPRFGLASLYPTRIETRMPSGLTRVEERPLRCERGGVRVRAAPTVLTSGGVAMRCGAVWCGMLVGAGLVACSRESGHGPVASAPVVVAPVASERETAAVSSAEPAASVAPAPVASSSASSAPLRGVDVAATSLRMACADPDTGAYVGCRFKGRVAALAGPFLELSPSDHACRVIPAGESRVEPREDGKRLKVMLRTPPELEHRVRQVFQKGMPVCGAFFQLRAGYDPVFEGVIETPEGHPLLAFSDWSTRRSDLLREVSIRPAKELRRRRMEEDYWLIDRSFTVSYQGHFPSQHEGDEWHFSGATYWLRAAALDSSGRLPPWLGWRQGGGVQFELLALER